MSVALLPVEASKSPAENLRRYIQELRNENDLVLIEQEVDPDLEMAAICRRVYETEDKAPLFMNLKGSSSGGLFRILGAPAGASSVPGKRFIRIANSLGLPSDLSEVCWGPVKEHKLFGNDIDLTAVPNPKLHLDDGGKFTQTFGIAMLHGPRTLVGPVIPRQDIRVTRQMWLDRGEDMPFALCFGVPPVAIMVSAMPIPKGVNEAGYVGALTGNPVEVVKCETNDIYVPAFAEIVYEGFVSATETAPEGPMAEYHGLIFPGESRDCPLFKVNAIAHRTDPILPICVTGRAPEESHTVW
ncbi:3-octaprenyl-4-hydroxybenzoate carboxy-lyase [Fusarium austroafricanum]|uniref:3-octaprenyl-4-hydroxybenzoate carboxy-lyase n=1 Tax=Fusarium austroafricanum TaxID=2364996 RepID=A0A8H4K279_9HYPO|nr:3-octaprenyl-4-hydroxybenzoate carboxy-lyase [Fusarium austroafricanum]